MKSWLTFISYFIYAHEILCFDSSTHIGCTQRVNYHTMQRTKKVDCQQLKPICRQKITVAFSLFPPYAMEMKNGRIDGILPGKSCVTPSREAESA